MQTRNTGLVLEILGHKTVTLKASTIFELVDQESAAVARESEGNVVKKEETYIRIAGNRALLVSAIQQTSSENVRLASVRVAYHGFPLDDKLHDSLTEAVKKVGYTPPNERQIIPEDAFRKSG